MAKLYLDNEDLEKVVGGAAISMGANGLEVDMTKGKDSVNDLFSQWQFLIKMAGGDAAINACGPIKDTLNKYSSKITKCVINTSTFVPTYYIGDTAYTQAEVNEWK